MKLLHINSYFSTSGLFKNLFDRQVKQGHDLQVYVPISYSYPEKRLAAKGNYCTISRNHPQWSRWLFPIKHHLIWSDMLKHLPLEQYELVHAHSLFSNGWLARQVYLKFGIPYVVAVRNADLHTFFERMPWMRPLGRQILEDAKQIYFISQNTYQTVFDKYLSSSQRQRLESKTQVIANGIDDYWHQHRYKVKEPLIQTPLKIVSAGKIMTGKRFVEMAEMAQEWSQDHGPVEVHIAGPNWDQKVLDQLKALDHVHYHGPLNKEEMVNLYRQMDLFALLSFPETFGLVYPEAMSQGLPVIYTKNEGFDSFFPNYHVGVSVDRFSSAEFTSAINYIRDNYTQLSQNALAGISSFKWDDIVKRYELSYQKVLTENS